MRLKESIVVSASPQEIWDYLEDPANWLHFMSGRDPLGGRRREAERASAPATGC